MRSDSLLKSVFIKIKNKEIEINQELIFKNYSFWFRARKISCLTGEVYKKDILSITGDSENNLYLIGLLKFLEINEFISIIRNAGEKNIIKVDNGRLSWWIRDGEPFKEFKELLNINFAFEIFGIPLTKPYYIGG